MFERQNVHEGATVTQWRRNGRVVRHSCLFARSFVHSFFRLFDACIFIHSAHHPLAMSGGL